MRQSPSSPQSTVDKDSRASSRATASPLTTNLSKIRRRFEDQESIKLAAKSVGVDSFMADEDDHRRGVDGGGLPSARSLSGSYAASVSPSRASSVSNRVVKVRLVKTPQGVRRDRCCCCCDEDADTLWADCDVADTEINCCCCCGDAGGEGPT